ncbi:acylaminoacyl-peptidase [Enterococcus casseliflavus]|uniref:acylaminoacyl-peptidase n=1 Tax=Enterococcus casseliflavus TaxID=37734 RepID=UPI003D11DB77
MRAERIEQILSKHGVAESKELSMALEEILKEFSKDRDLAKRVSENISHKQRQQNRMRGIPD